MCTGLTLLFVAIERQISVRSTREELIRRGILKDADVDERSQVPVNSAPAGDPGTVLGESEIICSVLIITICLRQKAPLCIRP